MTLRHVGTFVLAMTLAVCAPTSALAGNGNGKDKGDGNGNGNSANAPGHVKKAEAAAQEAQAAQTSQASQAQTDAGAAVQQPAAGSAQTGVKPSNDTAHDTYAPAGSDKTKQYGNGKTAGQIAMQNGAATTATLHGPGNSQPHKVSPCAGGHEVDVHALKGKRSGSCGSSQPTPTPTPTPHPTPVPEPGPQQQTVTPTSTTPTATPSTPAAKPRAVVELGGVTPKPGRPHSNPRTVQSGVLSSNGAVAGVTTLPFTGLDLWSAVFVGVMLILIGLAVCRRAATLRVCESEQEARP
jgi:hypothetical protein